MSNNNEDFLAEIEKLKNKKTTVKKNGKKKGNRGELELVHLLNERFKPHKFMRVPNSGAIFGASNYAKNSGVEQQIIEALSSDIITPSGFLHALEHKFYSQDSVRLGHLLRDKEEDEIKDWWLQASTDAKKSNKNPLLVIKLDNSERVCVIKYDVLKEFVPKFNNILIWKNKKEMLVIVRITELFELPDSFFFK